MFCIQGVVVCRPNFYCIIMCSGDNWQTTLLPSSSDSNLLLEFSSPSSAEYLDDVQSASIEFSNSFNLSFAFLISFSNSSFSLHKRGIVLSTRLAAEDVWAE